MVKKKTADFNSFVCFDFETTGLSADSKVIEIGAVKVKDGYMVSRYSSLVDPGVVIDPMITTITGITNEMVEGKPTIEQLIPSFYEYTEGLTLVAHNAPFDCRFLERDSRAMGYCFDHDVFDTLSYARKVLPKLPSYKLTVLTELFGIPQNEAHRAWCDAEATARLYMHLKAKEKKENDDGV
ncbi:MAG: 3'-5' exoribonuclease [Clostridia bacterium]|nr:3'-5' exoribonuclease [Clostridia bacterium]